MIIDLHHLANAGGYGSGRKALRESGAWDEYAGLKPRQYRVTVDYSVSHTDRCNMTIEARTEDEAIDKVCDAIEEDLGMEIDIDDAHGEVIGDRAMERAAP